MSLPDRSLAAAIRPMCLAVLQQFPVDHTVILLPQLHSGHHPLCLPLRCLVLYLVVFFSCSFPNLQSFFLVPNRALSLVIPPPAFQQCFLLSQWAFHSVLHHISQFAQQFLLTIVPPSPQLLRLCLIFFPLDLFWSSISMPHLLVSISYPFPTCCSPLSSVLFS